MPTPQQQTDLTKTDILGVYPETCDTQALPERRFLKTSRALAITCIFFLLVDWVLAGFIFYAINALDLMVANPRRSLFLYISPIDKKMKPVEYNERSLSAIQLLVEGILRRYLMERFTLPWDNIEANKLWGKDSFVQTYSARDVKQAFQTESQLSMTQSRSENYIQEAHLYDLQYVNSNLWKAQLEVLDLPIPDPFKPLCDGCHNDQPTCLSCKVKNAVARHLYTVYMRTSFGTPTIENPTGVYVSRFYKIYHPTNPQSAYWDLPKPLQDIQGK